jgi:hypothetical protein
MYEMLGWKLILQEDKVNLVEAERK